MKKIEYRKLILESDIQKFKVLLQDNLDVNMILNRLKHTPMMYSIDIQRYNMFNFFVENGADPTLKDYVGDDIFNYLIDDEQFLSSGNCSLEYYDIQKKMIKKYPIVFKRLIDINIIHPDIKKEFYYFKDLNELNLL